MSWVSSLEGQGNVPVRKPGLNTPLLVSGKRIYLRSPFPGEYPGKSIQTVASTTHTTSMANAATVQPEWLVVDAENEVLGRLASKVAMIVRGKHKPSFTPHVNCGDHVIVINADKVRLTGTKMADKEYQRYSLYPGGQRVETAKDLLDRKPEALVERAVRGMLPKNRLGRRLFNNLHVVVGSEHKHEAQKPRKFDLNTIK